MALAALITIAATSLAGAAKASVTYTYTAPLLDVYPPGNSATLTVEFTTGVPLSPGTVYTALPADTLASTMTVSSTHGLGNFTLPVQIFDLNTDSAGTIAAWFIWSDVNTLLGIPPTMTGRGRDTQAYTINSLSDAVPFPPGVSLPVNYDQATVTDFYTSCAGVPGCVLAGDGQPYVSRFSGITNPSVGTWAVRNVSSIPEPSTWAMMLLGFAGLGYVGHRASRRPATAAA
jgi:hypothetical protein